MPKRITKTKQIVLDNGDSINVRKLPTDWKGIAAIIGSILAVLGFFWNKIESYATRDRNDRMQELAYVKLAEKMDELYIKTAALEQVVHLLPSLLSRKPEKIDRAVNSVKTVLKEAERKPEPAPKVFNFPPDGASAENITPGVRSPEAVLPEPKPQAQRKFPAADLPSFQMVQKAAE